MAEKWAAHDKYMDREGRHGKRAWSKSGAGSLAALGLKNPKKGRVEDKWIWRIWGWSRREWIEVKWSIEVVHYKAEGVREVGSKRGVLKSKWSGKET